MEPFPTTGVTFAGDDETFFAAAPLPTVGAGRITGNTPSYTGADDQRLVFLVSIPADVTWGSDQTLVRVYTSGSVARWEIRSEEHTSELQSLMRNSYAVFCLTKKTK